MKTSCVQASIPTCSELALVHKSLCEYRITQLHASCQSIISPVYRISSKCSLLLCVFVICIHHNHKYVNYLLIVLYRTSAYFYTQHRLNSRPPENLDSSLQIWKWGLNVDYILAIHKALSRSKMTCACPKTLQSGVLQASIIGTRFS